MSQWRPQALAAIDAAHDRLHPHATYQERVRAFRGTCPFPKGHDGYRVWCNERRKYLERYRPDESRPLSLAPYDMHGIHAALLMTIEE